MTILLVLTVVVALALVAYGLANAWHHVLHEAGPLPLYGMLRHQGLTLIEAGDAASIETLAFAARRCTFCASGADCRQRVAAGLPPPGHCPNAGLFAQLTRARV